MISLLPVFFLFVACLYAMAGFGGGSTYIALLAASGAPLSAVPVIALTCNVIVSTQGSVALIRRRHANFSLLVPLLASSIPAAFVGGAWRLPQETFIIVLAAALTLAGVSILIQNKFRDKGEERIKSPSTFALVGAGLVLGSLAGITGIGGGIYLAPLMHLMGWAQARTIATCTSLFIALNSLAGLGGQLTKGLGFMDAVSPFVLIACPIAVLVGGRLGTYLLIEKLPLVYVRSLTAFVILLVATRLWLKATIW